MGRSTRGIRALAALCTALDARGDPFGVNSAQTFGARTVALAAAMFILPLGLSLGVFGDSCAMGSVEGSIVSHGEPFGDYTMQPTNCFSLSADLTFGGCR